MFKKYFLAPLAALCFLACSFTSVLAGEPLPENPSDLIYHLATLGCADESKGDVETRLIEIGPDAELALWDAIELGPTEAQLNERRALMAAAYQKRFGTKEAQEKYSTDRLKRMHATNEQEFIDYRVGNFVRRYNARAQAALENVQYAREHQQGFWKREVYVSEVSNGVALSVFPNPFRDRTTVQFSTNSGQHLQASVFDLSGREVASMYNGYASELQTYSFEFDGSELNNGTYIFRVVTDNGTHTTRMVLAR